MVVKHGHAYQQEVFLLQHQASMELPETLHLLATAVGLEQIRVEFSGQPIKE